MQVHFYCTLRHTAPIKIQLKRCSMKLQRLPFIRSTATEASTVVHRTNKVNTSGLPFDFNRWFQNVRDNGVYDTFYRLLNQSHFTKGLSLGFDSKDSLTPL